MAPPLPKEEQDALDLVVRKMRRMSDPHDRRMAKYKARYDAWAGNIHAEPNADAWMSSLAPKWVFQKIDVLLAHLVDASPTGKVQPQDPDDTCCDAADLMQQALNEFRRRDGRNRKYYPWVTQALVMGISPAKISWRYEEATITKQNWVPGVGGMVQADPKLVKTCLWDQPTFTPIPVEDFLWDPSATRMEDCGDCIHRTWETIEQLRWMEDAGVYKNVDLIEPMRAGSAKPSLIQPNSDRKGRIEVLEYWTHDRLIVVANRRVVLRDQEHPYWHRKLPFVVGLTLQDMYRMDGFSEVELLAELQAACWEFLNQKIDNTRFISNAMLMIHGDLDAKKLRWEPGGYVNLQNNEAIDQWTPNISVVQPLIQAEQDLRQVMDDISGVTPYISGAGSEGVDPQTATLVNAMQTMAARRVQKKRNLLYTADEQAGLMEVQLIQQLMDKAMALRVDTDEGTNWNTIEPWQVAMADLSYEVTEVDESINRQERRAEAQQLWSMALATPPGPDGQPVVHWNYEQLAKDVLGAFDKENPERYLTPPPPMPMMPMTNGAPGGPGGNGAPAPPSGPPNGAGANSTANMLAQISNQSNAQYAGNPSNAAPAGPAGGM